MEAARVKGSWSELPELIRKVTKHAPKQTALIQTVTAEHTVATHVGQRPPTATQTSNNAIETLRQAVDGAQNPLAEENFQGKTCLAWAASAGLISTSGDSFNTADVVALFDRYGQKGTSTWTKICLLKAVYIQGRRHAQRDEEQQTQYLYKTAVTWIELHSDVVRSVPQLAYWAEQILAEYTTAQSSAMPTNDRLKALQIWSTLTSKSQEVSSSTFGNTLPTKSRGTVWRTYYNTLSQSLAEPQHQSSAAISRSEQASQLRAVESAYETVLLRQRKFPKATESNAPVEDWVEQVIRNWHILCGPGWSDSDLGEGGRNAVTRNVLDVLYRAATKTFHSTLILRRLFQVHKSLTEFDLAYRCLDTYIELTERARARSAKSQEPDPNQDSDEIMLLVVAEGIEGLCAFGRQDEAQKAYHIAEKLEDWLEQMLPEEQPNAAPNGHAEPVHTIDTRLSEPPSEEALQTVYRAIGIAKAHWARWTPFSERRSELQSEAMTDLQKACTFSEPQLPTLYALAVLCAETRDIPQAIRATKVALERISRSDTQNAQANRETTAFWHLMTLLLSSQQDFETALHSSSAALYQILSPSTRSERFRGGPQNGSVEKQNEKLGGRTADDLECDDLQRVIELQISYLAIVELVDGPEAALNHSNELLSLYSKMFKRFEVGEPKAMPEQSIVPPKSSAGTIKSVRGSIFSRNKGAAPSVAPSVTTASLNSVSQTPKPVRPGTQASQAPKIQVTDETGKSPTRKHHHHHLPLHHKHHDDASKTSNPLSKSGRPGTASTVKGSSTLPPAGGTSYTDFGNVEDATKDISPTGHQHDTIAEAKQPIGEVPHNLDTHDDMPPPTGHKDQPPEQDIRLPTVHSHTTSTSPIPRFAKAAAQKHALVVLNKIWLITSTLYRRSHMFEDAKEATEEAAKAASRIEALVSATDPSARALAESGWGGGGKSADEVWADVHCSRAELLLAIAKRREEEGQPLTSESLREVVEQYEHCLMYYPNHAKGIIGLSNILLDYYEKKIDLAKKVDGGRSLITPTTAYVHLDAQTPDPFPATAITPGEDYITSPFSLAPDATNEDLRKTPENLNRIAARDRAYGLLSTLTKLGTGWDDSEAWFALARAHELGGMVDKAKQILWWVIELEDTRPVRGWRNLGCGGYVL